jgi:hypothetical protein
MIKKAYIGIDVGAQGGVSIIYDNGTASTHDYLDISHFRSRIEQWCIEVESLVVALEKQWIQPMQGVKSGGAMMETYGKIQGVLETVKPRQVPILYNLEHG